MEFNLLNFVLTKSDTKIKKKYVHKIVFLLLPYPNFDEVLMKTPQGKILLDRNQNSMSIQEPY